MAEVALSAHPLSGSVRSGSVRTAVDILDAAARDHHDRPALRTTGGAVTTYSELAAESTRLAGALLSAGVRPGSAVALLADHAPETITAILAIARAGAFYVPVDPRWPVARATVLLNSLHVRALIVGPALRGLAFEIAGELDGPVVTLRTDRSPTRPPTPAAPDPDAMVKLWNGISASAKPVEAAGFNLDRGSYRYTQADINDYARHVAALVHEQCGSDGIVVEIGAGSGLIAAEVARHVAHVHATDPAGGAMDRLASRALAEDLPITTTTCFAHEVSSHLPELGLADVAVLSSVVQYFPGPDYLRRVLHDLFRALPAGRKVVVADVIAPMSGQFPDALRLPARWWTDLAQTYPGLDVQVREREFGCSDNPLRQRYDVVLTVPEQVAARPSVPRRGSAESPWYRDELPSSPELPALREDDFLYTISTSGSTGTPKAVAVRHGSVVNLVDWFNERNAIDRDDVLLQVASFAFDLSVYDIFGVLAAGGCLLLLPDVVLADPARVTDALLDGGVTLWNSAPAAFNVLLPYLRDRPQVNRTTLRRVFLSGDWVPLSTLADLQREFPAAVLVALGGATEACVWSNDFVVSCVDPEWNSIPYGHPMRGARYHVLREDQSECVADEAGELYIAGDCVTEGYLNDASLTAAKFVPDPWGHRQGSRMYRTGDRAKWTSDGWVEFLGRLDNQVKIRGHRVELGDVEHAAQRMPAVDEAVAVVFGPDHEPDLGLVVRTVGELAESAVREHLKSRLPSYMLPARIHVVATLPLSGTGKVDRGALRAMLTTAAPAPVTVEELPPGPQSVVQREFAAMLGRDQVDPDDDFFDLGGDSLRALKLVMRLGARHGLDVDIADFYECPTVRGLVALARR